MNAKTPADRYWGAQTQRSFIHFSIGNDRMPKRVYHPYGYVKAAALVHATAGQLPQWKADAIVRAADEAIAGKLDEHFPLCDAGRCASAIWSVARVLFRGALSVAAFNYKLRARLPVYG